MTGFDLGNEPVMLGTTPERMFTAYFFDDPFTVLGIAPSAGRSFTADEIRSAAPVALIAERIASTISPAPASLVGSSIRIGGRPHTIVGLIPSVENMPSGSAIRPGDVLTGASGKTVEVINTDAEGRLILGDALWYARELGCTHLIDVATLTGACVVALGKWVSGLFGNDEAWVRVVADAGWRAGDRLWPMPIYEEVADQLKSDIADLVNSAGRPGGAVTAAGFLREFAGDGPWAHLDIAGTAWSEEKKPYQPKGPTGVAVRTLIELALTGGRSESAD